jgi:hypothetical protein
VQPLLAEGSYDLPLRDQIMCKPKAEMFRRMREKVYGSLEAARFVNLASLWTIPEYYNH